VLLDPKGVILGRGSECDVILDHSQVSRAHARISQDPFGRWIIEDLESHNGVLVEGRRIKAQAVLPNQKISIRPFSLCISQDFDRKIFAGSPFKAPPIIDKGLQEDIISYSQERPSVLSPVLMQRLNEITGRLLQLSRPSRLYSEACLRLADMLDTLVAMLRLPCGAQPLPPSPEILACYFGADTSVLQSSYIHFSKRVLDAVRTANAPVMASSRRPFDQNMKLTIVDEHKPHLVFSARVNELGESIDALYIDILESKSPPEMFDFVEAVARQINFAQKNLFLAELTKQEKALRQANLQLREKDRIKDEYVYRVTHDIKGHLAAIESCLYVAADKSIGPLNEKQFDFLTRASNRTRQLTTFVKELLSLTQMRLSGQMKMEVFSLAQCICNVLASVDRNAKDKSITITSNIDPSLGQMVGNEFSISEMLSNLLLNAIKYTPENKSVYVEARNLEDRIQIDVCDTGIGIPADEIPNVFDEFFRASNAREREKDGTGLGLSIVKQIVERHNGEISVRSQQGQGTTFTVTLPKDNPVPICS